MRIRHARRLWLAVGCIGALLLTGCATHFTGGGWLWSANGTDKVTFGITYKCTDISSDGTTCHAGRANGTYHDREKNVHLKFTGPESATILELPGTTFPCMDVVLAYTSIKPFRGQEGTVSVDACDNGEPGISAGDTIDIEVLSGPFTGYTHSGTLQGGNFKSH